MLAEIAAAAAKQRSIRASRFAEKPAAEKPPDVEMVSPSKEREQKKLKGVEEHYGPSTEVRQSCDRRVLEFEVATPPGVFGLSTMEQKQCELHFIESGAHSERHPLWRQNDQNPPSLMIVKLT